LLREGHVRVAGIDEVGRGAWAGPVVAAAVILNLAKAASLRKVHDSKQLSPHQRATFFPIIKESCLAWGVGLADASEIDAMGIVPATRLAMHRAIEALSPPPDALIIDALRLPDIDLPQRAFPFADSISLSVAAASILAKVMRDRMMVELESTFPGYGFDRHKGYGTRAHQEALKAIGACKVHRKTFRPIQPFTNEKHIMKQIKFYRTSGKYGCFSNFAPYPIQLKGKTWPTSEHYFQAQKFVGAELEEEIRLTKSPMIAVRMGRDRKKPPRPDWEEVKDDIMREAVLAKFSQHPDLQQILFSTNDAILIEHTKDDRYWGDGGDGRGKNLLGKILMEVREKLKLKP